MATSLCPSSTEDTAVQQSQQMALRVLRRDEVQKRLGIARSTIYAYLNQRSATYRPEFPKPVYQGAAMGFIEQEVDEYVLGLMRARGS